MYIQDTQKDRQTTDAFQRLTYCPLLVILRLRKL